jgi:hypothetical protein
MSNKRYTDQDIQDFLDGSFSGDQEDFQLFIEQNPVEKKKLEFYKSLFSLMSQQEETGQLPVNLAEQVVILIERKQRVKEAKEAKLASLILVTIVLIVIALSLSYIGLDAIVFSFGAIPGIIAVLIMGLFIWLFAKVDIDAKRRIYSSPY